MKNCMIIAEVSQAYPRTDNLQVGTAITSDDGKFSLSVTTECPTFELKFQTIGTNNEPVPYTLEDNQLTSTFLSNSDDHNLGALYLVFPMFFKTDFHNTKPFDKNDKLLTEYTQNGVLLTSKALKTIESREEYLGDSLDFKYRSPYWIVFADNYLKIKMTITKNNKTQIREDSVFCKTGSSLYSSFSKRIEY